jgi:hypothetical protein
MYGLQENFLDVAYSEFFWTTQTTAASYPSTPSGGPDAVRVMWTDVGNARLPEETGGACARTARTRRQR